jgi:predicted nucleotidyltransferase
MLNLYKTPKKIQTHVNSLNNNERISIKYHDLFDYPLTFADLIKWKSAKQFPISNLQFTNKQGFYFLEGREGLIYKRVLRKRISMKKFEIAKRASNILSFVPTVQMAAVTGSLAMENSSEDSDIDLMIITKKGTLWTTRVLSYLVLRTMHYVLRRPSDRSQKDKLCMNIWLDESDLVWKRSDRNIYTAHEIAQIVPLVNKNKNYERFLSLNKWILDYWPNAVKIRNSKFEIRNKFEFSKFKYLNIVSDLVLRASNLVAFKMQHRYMKKKITRETITLTKALFHPQDWGKVVLKRLVQG